MVGNKAPRPIIKNIALLRRLNETFQPKRSSSAGKTLMPSP